MRFIEREVVWPIEGGGRHITLSADGQLLDEDLTKCSEVHDVTSSSHYSHNVFGLKQFSDAMDENHSSNS